ncbi:Hemimethylated DNA-binding protein YccV like-domain-containing protein [Coniella lustricola]|uniref:Hemimethylated DNA-binding protein YccV like-domain-containing protein n=1 Tax=Coniella lustricola TaxID=2025994 RepID=A0A2T3A4S4_9PEZI|nr:Hemimethylated DNA-binding protein YccV like-domain-containing protein [Coniella lustricola]
MPHLLELPDELIGAILNQTDAAADTAHFGQTCTRLRDLEAGSPVWQQHCLATWHSWAPRHKLQVKLAQPVLQTDWRALYRERRVADRDALATFDALLLTQLSRGARMNKLALLDLDAEDLFAGIADKTPEEAEDVLARRWYADAILGLMFRRRAIEIWAQLQRGEHVDLEVALAAYDQFVLGRSTNIETVKSLLDRHAARVQCKIPGFRHMSTRRKAVHLAQYLRDERVVTMSDPGNYHDLRHNFIGLPLSAADAEEGGCLPLQSVAIYCAVARRLGMDAAPSSFPRHVHAIVTAPADATLDGHSRSHNAPRPGHHELEMRMDVFRQSEPVPHSYFEALLAGMGVPHDEHAAIMGPATTAEMVLRAGRNIFMSVEEGLRGATRGNQSRNESDEGNRNPAPDLAQYAALWSLFMLGDSDPLRAATRRRQVTRQMLEVVQTDYPQDAALFSETAPRLLHGLPELTVAGSLLARIQTLETQRTKPKLRPTNGQSVVVHRVGTYCEHRKYGYQGFITGWDPQCAAAPEWIRTMDVDTLLRGRGQPFYNIVDTNNSKRYVAEENIEVLSDRPPRALMKLAGKYFKRWDDEAKMFVSNVRDKYPED